VKVYPNVTQDEKAGLKKACSSKFSSRRDFQPRCAHNAGSIHEGGELGYSLSHGLRGVVFDQSGTDRPPCVVGDGEAGNGPLATAWPVQQGFLRPHYGRSR